MVPRAAAPHDKFSWSARDNVNYNETGALAALDYAAGNAQMLLHDFYVKGFHSWRKGAEEPPFAFIIPSDQGDPARVAQMVGRLMAQHIEVSRSEAPFTLEEGAFRGYYRFHPASAHWRGCSFRRNTSPGNGSVPAHRPW